MKGYRMRSRISLSGASPLLDKCPSHSVSGLCSLLSSGSCKWRYWILVPRDLSLLEFEIPSDFFCDKTVPKFWASLEMAAIQSATTLFVGSTWSKGPINGKLMEVYLSLVNQQTPLKAVSCSVNPEKAPQTNYLKLLCLLLAHFKDSLVEGSILSKALLQRSPWGLSMMGALVSKLCKAFKSPEARSCEVGTPWDSSATL